MGKRGIKQGSSKRLTIQQEQFARLIAEGVLSSAAYAEVFPSSSRNAQTLAGNAMRMLNLKSVAARVKELRDRAATTSVATLEESLLTLTQIMRADHRRVFDENGLLKPVNKLTAEEQLIVGSRKVVRIAGGAQSTEVQLVSAKDRSEAARQLITFHMKRMTADELANFGKMVNVEPNTMSKYDLARRIARVLTGGIGTLEEETKAEEIPKSDTEE